MTSDGKYQYGYGFGIHSFTDSLTSLGHNGGSPGCNTTLRVYSNGYVMIMLANRDPQISSIFENKFTELIMQLKE